MKQICTGVLVIGGGGAGARAAVEAAKAGAETLLVTKTRFGHGGATAHRVSETGGFNVGDGCLDNEDSPAEHYSDIMRNALGMCDPELARIVAYEAQDALHYLESIGVSFERKDGRYLSVHGCFASRPRMHILRGHGHPIMIALGQELERLQVPILSGYMVIDLVVHEGRCVGALALDKEGELVRLLAKSTVLACGGTGNLFQYTLFPSDVAGSSYGLGYRAGARLSNMEFMQYGLGVAHPRRFTFRYWLWYLLPDVYNASGERFLQQYLPEGISEDDVKSARARHAPFTSADVSRYLDIAIKKEIQSGRGTPANGVYVDFTRISKQEMERRMPGDFRHVLQTTRQTLLERHVDIDREPVQVSLFSHATNGGMAIDEYGRTSIEGLYAAGEAASGPHGADRLGGNMLLTSQIFGRRAGTHAASAAADLMHVPSRIPADRNSLQTPLLAAVEKGEKPANQVMTRLRKLMWDEVLVVRTNESLTRAMNEIQTMRAQEYPRVQLRAKKDAWDKAQLRDLLDVAELMTLTAQTRKESRGGHYRDDYPDRNDAEWNVNLFVSRGADGPEISSGTFSSKRGQAIDTSESNND